ncbi:MAG TPA: 5-oxoprolinase subunit PxpB [Pyrinomonadaceae bacterium]|jgi:inhibitor of KinA
MNSARYKIFPLGDNALTIEFGSEISPALNDRAVNLAQYLENNPFPGLIETVPAYSSLTVFYDVRAVRRAYPENPTAFEAVKNLLEKAHAAFEIRKTENSRLVRVPVDFSPDCAPDLVWLANRCGLTAETVVEIFTARRYRVYMLGFMPGFAYMGEVDERLATPRKSTPRLRVPKGSVGIAGSQTGIYPFDSPGGWQIIGKTGFELFTPRAANPCALAAGDEVEFYQANE